MIVRPLTYLILGTGLLMAACSPSAPPGSLRGNPEASQPSSSRTQTAEQPGGSGRAAPPVQVLDASELGAVYGLLLQQYVDEPDADRLLNAAQQTLHDIMVRSGFLPLDLGVITLTRTPVGAPDRDWRRFAEGYDALIEKHTAWAREARPDYAVLKGLTEALQDNQTIFIERDEFRRSTEATYAGIGVRLSKPDANQAPVIVEVFPRSPALQSGLRPGDRILAVDGQRIAEMALGEVVKRIRGPVGTRLDLSLARGVQASPFSVEVTRAAVEPRRVEARIVEPGIGYLRIRGFGSEVPSQVAEQLARGRQQDVRGWIIDLRGNGGGSLSAAANVAGSFFPGQPLAVSVDRAGNREPINADGRKLISNEQVYVLTDRDTSGGGEILAAALREYRIATTIGAPTSGAVGIAIPHELSDGSAVQITVRRLLTPEGARIDRDGLRPDEDVPLSVSDLEAGKDPPFERAVQRIRERIGQVRR